MTTLNIDDIKKYLPHRYPFIMVDKIVEVKPGEYIKAIKNLTVNEEFFNGHFPNYPVMPGVLILEALAQAAGILTFQTNGTMPTKDDLYFLAGIDNARFKKTVRPGDQLILEIKVLKTKKDLWKFDCKASVDGELACRAEIMTVKGQ